MYFLQQSNEKLAKGLLLSIGFLTPKKAKEDLRIQSILGFLPKQPVFYRHRTLPSFLSDIEKAVPAIEDFLTFIEQSEFGPRIAQFQIIFRNSKKGVQKLKKKPSGLIQSAEQLEKEIEAAHAILNAFDNVQSKMNEELEKLDIEETVKIATKMVKEAGFNVGSEQSPSVYKIKEWIIPVLSVTILATISVALSSLLDPLESITRYPDSEHRTPDQNNPYILNFNGLHDVIRSILKKAKEITG